MMGFGFKAHRHESQMMDFGDDEPLRCNFAGYVRFYEARCAPAFLLDLLEQFFDPSGTPVERDASALAGLGNKNGAMCAHDDNP